MKRSPLFHLLPFFLFLFLFVLVQPVSLAFISARITEVQFNPIGQDSVSEFVEFLLEFNESVNASLISFRDANSEDSLRIQGNLSDATGRARLVISPSPGYPCPVLLTSGPPGNGLSNTDDSVEILYGNITLAALHYALFSDRVEVMSGNSTFSLSGYEEGLSIQLMENTSEWKLLNPSPCSPAFLPVSNSSTGALHNQTSSSSAQNRSQNSSAQSGSASNDSTSTGSTSTNSNSTGSDASGSASPSSTNACLSGTGMRINIPKRIYEEGEKVLYTIDFTNHGPRPKVKYWIESYSGRIAKQPFISATSTQKSFTPRLSSKKPDSFTFRIVAESLPEDNCPEESAEEYFTVVSEPTEAEEFENSILLEAEDTESSCSGKTSLVTIPVKVSATKGDSRKKLIVLRAFHDGNPVSKPAELKLPASNSVAEAELEIPAVLPCNSSVMKVTVTAEGLGLEENREALVNLKRIEQENPASKSASDERVCQPAVQRENTLESGVIKKIYTLARTFEDGKQILLRVRTSNTAGNGTLYLFRKQNAEFKSLIASGDTAVIPVIPSGPQEEYLVILQYPNNSFFLKPFNLSLNPKKINLPENANSSLEIQHGAGNNENENFSTRTLRTLSTHASGQASLASITGMATLDAASGKDQPNAKETLFRSGGRKAILLVTNPLGIGILLSATALVFALGKRNSEDDSPAEIRSTSR
ncbi:hypothetical protein D6764_03385 [Candidatus Woesearchaeota archaeon]|nr:MAG: hypothetical protein D6764_03385 [Candidatus Woesearchaeota archaeon]